MHIELKFLNPFFYVGILMSPLILIAIGIWDGMEYIVDKWDQM